MLSNSEINKIYNEFSSTLEDFDIHSDGNIIAYRTKDIYGCENNGTLNAEDKTYDEVYAWINKIVKHIKNVQKLNNSLEDHEGDFKVEYRCIINEETAKNSIISDWGYGYATIALSLDSLELLNKNISMLEEETDRFISYNSLNEFIADYFDGDPLVSALEIKFEHSNIYDNIEAHQLNKEAIINKVKSLNIDEGMIKVKSTLASKALGILCKIVWEIDFDNVNLDIEFDENKIYSTTEKRFIRDKEILDGLLKLYKPSMNEIFENE